MPEVSEVEADSQGLAGAGESSGGDTDSDDAGSHSLAWKNLTENVSQ